jgi:hypothetical protein
VKSCPSSGAFTITVRSFLAYLSIGFLLNPTCSRFFRSIALKSTCHGKGDSGENELRAISLGVQVSPINPVHVCLQCIGVEKAR